MRYLQKDVRCYARDDSIVTYKVTDDKGAFSQNSFTITVTGTNDAPVATFTTAQHVMEGSETLNGQLTGTDVDSSQSQLTYSLDGASIPGLIINSDGSWSFDPTDSAYDSIEKDAQQVINVTYKVSDEYLAAATGTFTITVTGTNDVPTVKASPSVINIDDFDQGQSLDITNTFLITNIEDVDDNSVLTAFDLKLYKDTRDSGAADAVWSDEITENASQSWGSLAKESNNVDWKFTPDTLFYGDVRLTYKVKDQHNATVKDGSDDKIFSFEFNIIFTNTAPTRASMTIHADDVPSLKYVINESQLLEGWTDADGDDIVLDYDSIRSIPNTCYNL